MKNVNFHHKMKNINVHHYLFLSETYEPEARGTCPLHSPFGKILKSWIFRILYDFCDIYYELPLFNTTKLYER